MTKTLPYSGDSQGERAKSIPSNDWEKGLRFVDRMGDEGKSFGTDHLAEAIFGVVNFSSLRRAGVVRWLMVSSKIVIRDGKVPGWYRLAPERVARRKGEL